MNGARYVTRNAGRVHMTPGEDGVTAGPGSVAHTGSTATTWSPLDRSGKGRVRSKTSPSWRSTSG